MARTEREDHERRSRQRLTDDEIAAISARAASIVIDAIYVEVGKVALRVILSVVGAVSVALLAWLHIVPKVIP